VKSKVFIGIAPLLAIAAFAVAPAVAQAEPHWYSNGTIIKEGEVVSTTSAGTITFTVKEEAKEYKVKCKVADKETITNPTGGGGGTDQVTEFALTGCAVTKKANPCPVGNAVEVLSGGLPWATHLVPGVGKRILDDVEVTALEIKCGGTLLHSFAGTLTPKIGKGVIQFGTGSGELKSGTFTATAKGAQTLKGSTAAEVITVANP